MMRLSQVARKLNVGLSTITEHLANKGFEVENKPNAKIPIEQFNMLAKEFASSALDKEEASGLTIGSKHYENQVIESGRRKQERDAQEEEELFIKNLATGKDQKGVPADKKEEKKAGTDESAEAKTERKEETSPGSPPKLPGFKVVGKIDLDSLNRKKQGGPRKEEKPEIKEKEPVAEPDSKKAESKSVPEVTPKEKPEPKQEKATPEPEKEQEKTGSELEREPKKEAAKPEKESETKKEVEEPEAKKDTPPPPPPAKVEKEEKPTPKEEKPIPKSEPKEKEKKVQENDTINAKADTLKGLTVLGKINLPEEKKKSKPVASSDEGGNKKKRKRRRRIPAGAEGESKGGGRPRSSKPDKNNKPDKKTGRFKKGAKPKKEEPSEKEIQDQIKETLAKLSGGGTKRGKSSRGAKMRQEKRRGRREREEQMLQEQQDNKVLKVTEFISANDLASMMDVSVNEVISTCMSLGMFVSINQRLDAETITVIADEFGFDVEFTDTEEEVSIETNTDREEDLEFRAPIVTIMGHVDHGKTSLLDYIRSAKVTEGEAGGITQHIGAYDVTTDSGKRVSFLDTPGHEAFTAMRARGAKVTDVVIVVVAADDNVMPQTKEAINHAQVAGVPIVIAINKIDRPNANPDKIREELANINILVEDWGGKYQCQEISAKTGQGVEDLLEKVLLEAELLELKANPKKPAVGTVIEATLDRGRGYVTTLLVQGGTLKVGDVILAGAHYGKVKAMFDHRGNRLKEAVPATPVQVLGLDGAPQAGDTFNVMESDKEAREVANRREQIQREQSLRTKKHITLDEIGRRLAIGSFKELNVIVKGDVDGSIEALSDSLLKLSTEEIQVNIIHKAVGQISESDVLLASASDAIIVGFQVRPSPSARNLAEKEEIEIRLYSIIYDAINEIRDAMEGMLAPKVEEVITGNIEVRRVFKISKVGTVAGCYVTDGSVRRNNQIRLIRDGIVAYTGEINQLKREKDDVNEVRSGYECGISIKNFNDIKVGDIIEGFEEKEVKRSL